MANPTNGLELRSHRSVRLEGFGARWLLGAGGVVLAASGAPGQTGACCTPSGACTLGTAQQCSTGSVYRGDGSSCASVVCPQPMGACCTGSGACAVRLRAACQLAGSTYIGDRVACGAGGGGAPICPLGACCLNDGACTAGLARSDCLAIAGTFRGIGSACAAIVCPMPVGACCSSTSCTAVTLTFCSLFQGTWRGPGTACGPNSTCPPAGVCCRGATCSAMLGPAECVAPEPGVGARFVAVDAECNVFGESKFPCCHADFNGSGALSAPDIFDFLNAWFAHSPFCHVGGNGVQPPTVQDILDFLGDWFAGC